MTFATSICSSLSVTKTRGGISSASAVVVGHCGRVVPRFGNRHLLGTLHRLFRRRSPSDAPGSPRGFSVRYL